MGKQVQMDMFDDNVDNNIGEREPWSRPWTQRENDLFFNASMVIASIITGLFIIIVSQLFK